MYFHDPSFNISLYLLSQHLSIFPSQHFHIYLLPCCVYIFYHQYIHHIVYLNGQHTPDYFSVYILQHFTSTYSCTLLFCLHICSSLLIIFSHAYFHLSTLYSLIVFIFLSQHFHTYPFSCLPAFCISNIFFRSLNIFMFIHFHFQICTLHYIVS